MGFTKNYYSIFDVISKCHIYLVNIVPAGDYPPITARSVKGNVVSSGSTEVKKGKATANHLQFKFGSAVSPPIADISKENEVSQNIMWQYDSLKVSSDSNQSSVKSVFKYPVF